MSTISTQLRNFKDPTKEELTELYFSIPASQDPNEPVGEKAQQPERMEINATLSMGPEAEEESYVSACVLHRPAMVDRK